jgi:hypothetical protein
MATEADITRDDKRSWAKKPSSVMALFFLLLLLLVVSPLLLYQPMEPMPTINVGRMRSNTPPDLNSFSVPEMSAPPALAATGGFNADAHEVSNSSNSSRN